MAIVRAGVLPAGKVVPTPFGLFSAADVQTRGPRDEHWGQGFAAMSEACAFDVSIHDICGGVSPVDVYVNDGDRFQSVRPFGILAKDTCPSVGFSAEDRRARVIRQLELATQKAVEREFWAGTYRSAYDADLPPEDVQPGTYLASGSTEVLSDTAQAPKVALALLEQGLADRGPGYQGVIHMSPLAAAMFGGLLDSDTDGVLLTQSGNRVVVGSGYDGSGPSGPAEQFVHWMYATGPMYVVLGSNELITVDEAQATNAQTNVMTYVAQRPAAVYSDGCLTLGVQTDIRL